MQSQKNRALMPQTPKKSFAIKSYHIKYIGLPLAFFMMIGTIRVFLNYATIQGSIEEVSVQREEIERHRQYLALQQYVYTLPISQVFMAHDNSILQSNERIITIMSGEKKVQTTENIETSTGINANTGEVSSGMNTTGAIQTGSEYDQLPPWKSWILYFVEKM